MLKPEYSGDCIVNLSRAIFGKDMNLLRSTRGMKLRKKVVLIVIDGMGYEYLKTHKDTFLWKNMHSRLTSVFPTTTASAITSFMTGLSPAEHGIVGWFTYYKELGSVIVPLMYSSRCGSFIDAEPEELFPYKPLFRKSSRVVMGHNIIDSPYNKALCRSARKSGYSTLSGMFRQIKKARENSIYAYWPLFDTICHHEGVASKSAAMHLSEIDKEFRLFCGRMKNASIFVTADHGLVDCRKTVQLPQRIYEMLALPLSGEPRVAYCFVRPGLEKSFVSYVKKHMSRAVEIHSSKDLVRQGYFGKRPSKKLFERVGDYVLMMKDGWIINDELLGEEKHRLMGNHGGLTEKELYVPLVHVDT